MKKLILITSFLFIVLCSNVFAQHYTTVHEIRLDNWANIVPDPNENIPMPANDPDLGFTQSVLPTLYWSHWYGLDDKFYGYEAYEDYYKVVVSTSPSFPTTTTKMFKVSGTKVIPSPDYSFTFGPYDVLQWDTVYYWQVRPYSEQYEGSVLTDVYFDYQSEISTFKTPKRSVTPFVKWQTLPTSTNGSAGFGYLVYTLSVFEGANTNSANLVFSKPLTAALIPAEDDTLTYYQFDYTQPDEILKYDTLYTVKISRGTLPTAINESVWTYQTKPLTVLGEYYYDGSSTIPQYKLVAPMDQVYYYALTDEFEDYSGYEANVNFTITTKVAVNNPSVKLDYLAPGDPDLSDFIGYDKLVILTRTFDIAINSYNTIPTPWEVVMPLPTEIAITNNDPVELQLLNSPSQTLKMYLLADLVNPLSLLPWTSAGLFEDDLLATPLTATVWQDDMFLYIDAPGVMEGNTITLVLENMDNPDQKNEITVIASAIDEFFYPILADEVNKFFYGSGYNPAVAEVPFRLAVYIEDSGFRQEFIWMPFTVNTPSGISFNKTAYDLTETVQIMGGTAATQYVRIISNIDPLGFIIPFSTAPNNTFTLGSSTNTALRQLKAGFAGHATFGDRILAVAFDFAGPLVWNGALNNYNDALGTAQASIIPQAYHEFGLITPTNFTSDSGVYPLLSWGPPAFDKMRAPTNTAYKLSITMEQSNFIAPAFGDPTVWIEPDSPLIGTPPLTRHTDAINDPAYGYIVYLNDEFWYPPVDLLFSKIDGTPPVPPATEPTDFLAHYYWRVDVVPTGENSAPENISVNGRWTFTTIFEPTGTGNALPSIIASDRELSAANSPYYVTSDVTVKAGATLTIPEGTELIFSPGTSLIIEGDLVVNGTMINPVIFSGVDWEGIQFVDGAWNSPLVVDEGNSWDYISGGSHLNFLELSGANNPITYSAGGSDVYLENSLLENNKNGVQLSPDSYLRSNRLFFTGTLVAGIMTDNGALGAYAIDGGKYIEANQIMGWNMPDTSDLILTNHIYYPHFQIDGIKTSYPDAIITNNIIHYIRGNGIELYSSTPTPIRSFIGATIADNLIQGTGLDANSFAIKANLTADIISNFIGVTYTDLKNEVFDNVYMVNQDIIDNVTNPFTVTYAMLAIHQRNTGFAIIGGDYIRENNIQQNGNTAITTTATNATIILNEIINNKAEGIVGGLHVTENRIFNDYDFTVPFPAILNMLEFRSTNAITALNDPGQNVTVVGNIILNNNGHGIKYGSEIVRNQINVDPGTFDFSHVPPDPALKFAIEATPGALVEENIVRYMSGFGILNGTNIKNNEIVSMGSYGILADIDAEIVLNTITDVNGRGIENGALIQDNTIDGCLDGILAQTNSLVARNNLKNGAGYAINGGLRIVLNTIENFVNTHTTRAGEAHIVYSDNPTDYIGNVITGSIAENGSIIYANKATGSLLFRYNKLTDNQYKFNHVYLYVTNLEIYDNEIVNNSTAELLPAIPSAIWDGNAVYEWVYTGGGWILNPANIASYQKGDATGLTVVLRDNNTKMQRNLIKGHVGWQYGAGLYIKADNPAFRITIDDQNTISGNHAVAFAESGTLKTGLGQGAGIYVESGYVMLGITDSDAVPTSPKIIEKLGNTITYNSIFTQVMRIASPLLHPNLVEYEAILVPPVTGQPLNAPAGAAIHLEQNLANTVEIWRNNISSNWGNWAIYGNPTRLHFNNIYQNNFEGKTDILDENEGELLYNPTATGYLGLSNYPKTNWYYITNPVETPPALHTRTTYNFWGTRQEQTTIINSVYNGDRITIQPIKEGPHDDTPGIVKKVAQVRVFNTLKSYLDNPSGNGVDNYSLDRYYTIIVTGDDFNEYSRGFTEVLVQNLSSTLAVQPLLIEFHRYADVYYGRFMLTSSETPPYDPVRNHLPGEQGNMIRITSLVDPTKSFTRMIAQTGSITIKPYLLEYTFIPWFSTGGATAYDDPEDDPDTWPGLKKKFTITNSGDDPIQLLGIQIAGANPTLFNYYSAFNNLNDGITPNLLYDCDGLWPGTVYGSIIPPGGSFEVIVEYIPQAAADDSALPEPFGPLDPDLDFATNPDLTFLQLAFGTWDGAKYTLDTLQDRRIALWASTVDEIIDLEIDDWGYPDPFGPIAIQTGQMLITPDVLVNSLQAHVGDIIAAYANTSMKEELRGKYRVLSSSQIAANPSLANMVIQTSQTGETIYFKVYDNENHKLYYTPDMCNIETVYNGVYTRTKHIIRASRQIDIYGQIVDDKNPTNGVPSAYLVNWHIDADKSTSGDQIRYATTSPSMDPAAVNPLADAGWYHIRTFHDMKLMITPELIGWGFIVKDEKIETMPITMAALYTPVPNPDYNRQIRTSEVPITGYQWGVSATQVKNLEEFSTYVNIGYELEDNHDNLNSDDLPVDIASHADYSSMVPHPRFVPSGDGWNYLTFSHTGVDFYGIQKMQAVAGQLTLDNELNNSSVTYAGRTPLANTRVLINLSKPDGTPDYWVETVTDSYGYFSTVAEESYTFNYVLVPKEELSAAGYADIDQEGTGYPIGYTIDYLNRETLAITSVTYAKEGVEIYVNRPITEFYEDELLELVLPRPNLRRTLKFELVPNWNLMSYNIDHTSSIPTAVWGNGVIFEDVAATSPVVISDPVEVPNAIGQVRYMNTTYDPSGPGTLTTVGKGYSFYIRNDNLKKAYYYKRDKTPDATATLRLDGNNWSMIGFTPAKPTNTRSGVKGLLPPPSTDSGIHNISSTTESYFETDDPIGASTLQHMAGGKGYWAQRTQPGAELQYKHVTKNDFLHTIYFTGFANGQIAIGEIENDYIGYPMIEERAILPNTALEDRMVVGTTYKITAADAAATLAFPGVGALEGLPGEIFTAMNKSLATVNVAVPAGGAVRHINAPKIITVPIPDSPALPQTLNIIRYSPLHEVTYKLFTEAEYLDIAGLLDGSSALPLDQSWFEFLNRLQAAPLPVPLSFTLTASTDIFYLIGFEGTALNTDELKQKAKVVTYRIEFKEYTEMTFAGAVLNAVVTTPAGPTITYFTSKYDSIRDRYVIALPDSYKGYDIAGGTPASNLYLAFSGASIYTAADPATPGVPDPTKVVVASTGNPFGPAPDNYTTFGKLGMKHFRSPVRLFVSDDLDAAIDELKCAFIYFIFIPDSYFPHLFPTPEVLPAPFSGGEEEPLARDTDPFGDPLTYQNSHFLRARFITPAGQPVNSNTILAAYVDGELRGKQKVMQWNSSTYVPITIYTKGAETVTFKYWREGMEEPYTCTEPNEAVLTYQIPAGSLTTELDYILFYRGLVDEFDEPEPLFINEMQGAYPNPFNPSTRINYSLKENQRVTISVYNIKGQKVITLFDGVQDRGAHHIIWNGVDQRGRATATGIYFVRMQTKGYQKVQKVLLMK